MENGLKPWQNRVHEIIYEADTPAGKLFDVVLIIFILLSVGVVMLESVAEYSKVYGSLFTGLELFFTVSFTIEYVLRLICIRKPSKYALSFFGVIDLLAILPLYLELILGSQKASYLAVIRILRVLRIFRVLKLAQYLKEANILRLALTASVKKITVFLVSILVLVVLFGSLMFLIEGGDDSNFRNIPESIYWAIVTITTVGYGDIAPVTGLGKFIAGIVMVMGYAIIAVPTGIVSVELNDAMKHADLKISTQACPSCTAEGHEYDADYCKKCGAKL